MNKKTLRIAGWALGLSMAVAGIGVAARFVYSPNNNSILVRADNQEASFSAESDIGGEKASVNGQTYSFGSNADVTVTFSKASAGTDSQYWGDGNVRSYAKSTFTVSCSNGNLKTISLTYTQTNSVSTNVGTYSSNNKTWTGDNNSVVFTVGGANGHIRLSAISVTYAPASSGPIVSAVNLNGSPALSSIVYGLSEWTMSATVSVSNDTSGTLSRDVEWSVLPVGAVTFSKTTSASGENITVTAVNANADNVVITATSKAEGFTTVHGDSNSFSIAKFYPINSVSLSATTVGGPDYDANGASSFDVDFTTAISYSSETGSNKVNISVSPNAGVSGYGNNVDAGAFSLTFTKNGTYTVTSTSVEDGSKSANTVITVSNIVAPTYLKASTNSDLRNKAEVMIGSSAKNTILGKTKSNNLITGISYVVSDDEIPASSVTENMSVWTLSSSGSEWELTTMINETKYWLAIDADGNRADFDTSSGDSTKWSISFSDGNCLMVPKNYSSRNLMANNSNGNFGCYGGTQSAIQLYVKADNSPYYSVNTSSVYLGNRGTQNLILTPHNGASDSVTWSSNNPIVSVSPTSGLSTTVTAADSGTGVATVTATFSSGEIDPIEIRVEVLALESYVNIGVTSFTKQTSTPAGGWEGTYLLVDETANQIFDGSASPLTASSEKDIVAPSENTIAATSDLLSSVFNVKESENGYTIRSNSNYYFGNRSTDNALSTSLGETYEVSIGSSGTITALKEDGTSTGTSLRHNSSINIFRFYSNSTGNEISLYKANGEVKAITSTLTSWYDAAKTEELLVCNASGVGSKIDLDALEDKAIELLTSDDLDILKRMSAKSSENNGNYLEDLISDYDYYIRYVLKNDSADFLGRFGEGGANADVSFANIQTHPLDVSFGSNETFATIVIVGSIVLVGSGGIFLISRRRREE